MKEKQVIGKELAVDAGIFLILYLFYRSMWVITLLLPCAAVYHRYYQRDLEEKRKSILNTQFKDMLESLAASLRAGYSVENALLECRKEMTVVHGEDSLICRELDRMEHQIRIGIRAEDLFQEFAERSGIEDVETFASVFSIAQKSGGDLVAIIRKTADDISDKIDTKNEIAVLISAKKLEQNIMMLIPALLILYVDLTSDGLLDPLYGNLTGVLIMTACLLIYGGAAMLGKKIIKIEV